ncbi:ABC transporter ATP-binding protein [Streptomyces sp. NPDC051784]|uniref:ABC transporter ATP-binding protein n=1 Tax=Streptomyces sp. NPDC051784 TaxID=3155805 RepID=UPI0034151736
MNAAVLRARSLGKRYRKRWALADCTLDVPTGKIVGLVGPNGAGKSTLLKLASGMLTPTTGTIEVCGGAPGTRPAQLAKVGYVAQDTPSYPALTVADHLTLGSRLNPGRWDRNLADHRVRRLGLDPAVRAGSLSGGQRAQLALTLGLAKRPDLLVLDEPVAALDPLARREFLRDLADAVAEQHTSVVLSSHLVSDVERVCDHLIVLVDSRVRIAGGLDELRTGHHWLSRPGAAAATDLPAGCDLVSAERAGGRTTFLVRGDAPAPDTAWDISRPALEDIVLAYLRTGSRASTADHTAKLATFLETSR